MKSLSGSNVHIQDQLFATLDTTTRKIKIDKKNSFILSDTVGFIRNLPDNLIASFRSTLGELVDSDLLLKIIDISSPEYQMHLESIVTVLNHLEISNKKYCIIFNKIDTIDDQQLIKKLKTLYPKALFVSAYKKIGINSIIEYIKNRINENNILKTIYIPYSQGKIINKVYSNFKILAQIEKDDHIEFKISGTKQEILNIIKQIKK